MKIYLAADHGGFAHKQELLAYLKSQSYEVIDCGTSKPDPNDDYPDFVAQLGAKMKIDSEGMGIVICRNGVGVSIVANRYSHLRCGLGINEAHVKSARVDDNINVLALAADYFDLVATKKMVDIFLNTPFPNLERHIRRLAKISNLSLQV
jgi:ribose 5-phosphate isomerase B